MRAVPFEGELLMLFMLFSCHLRTATMKPWAMATTAFLEINADVPVSSCVGIHVACVEVCASLECAQFGQCWHSGQLAVQRCHQPLCIVLLEVELMRCRRGEDFEEHDLVWIILSSGLV